MAKFHIFWSNINDGHQGRRDYPRSPHDAGGPRASRGLEAPGRGLWASRGREAPGRGLWASRSLEAPGKGL